MAAGMANNFLAPWGFYRRSVKAMQPTLTRHFALA
jgi:hypothetical protein